jgi:hypothetical protein
VFRFWRSKKGLKCQKENEKEKKGELDKTDFVCKSYLRDSKHVAQCYNQGCQICLGAAYQNVKNIPEMTTNYTK